MKIRILVDADACPSKSIIEKVAKQHSIQLVFYCCLSSIVTVNYGEVKIVDAGSQMVDMKIANEAKKGDIVISQDYGVAAMVLGKGCGAIHPKGTIYNLDNIDSMLMQRHISAKIRRGGGRFNNPKKRTSEDDEKLYKNLCFLINKYS